MFPAETKCSVSQLDLSCVLRILLLSYYCRILKRKGRRSGFQSLNLDDLLEQKRWKPSGPARKIKHQDFQSPTIPPNFLTLSFQLSQALQYVIRASNDFCPEKCVNVMVYSYSSGSFRILFREKVMKNVKIFKDAQTMSRSAYFFSDHLCCPENTTYKVTVLSN